MVKRKSKISLEDLAQKIDLYRAEVVNFKVDLTGEITELKEKISHLPTKEEFYNKEDQVLGRLQSVETQLDTTKHLYDGTNSRVDLIDQNLGINTAVVF